MMGTKTEYEIVDNKLLIIVHYLDGTSVRAFYNRMLDPIYYGKVYEYLKDKEKKVYKDEEIRPIINLLK